MTVIVEIEDGEMVEPYMVSGPDRVLLVSYKGKGADRKYQDCQEQPLPLATELPDHLRELDPVYVKVMIG